MRGKDNAGKQYKQCLSSQLVPGLGLSPERSLLSLSPLAQCRDFSPLTRLRALEIIKMSVVGSVLQYRY